MTAFKDLAGQSFGQLTVLSFAGVDRWRQAEWVCVCTCGQQRLVKGNRLTSGVTQQCVKCGMERGRLNKRKGCGDLTGEQWSHIRGKSRGRGRELEFSITIEYGWEKFQEQRGRCKLTDWPITLWPWYRDREGTYSEWGTASLDRIDSQLGYIEGNVQWVHKDANLMKMHFPEDYLYKMAKAFTETYEARGSNVK